MKIRNLAIGAAGLALTAVAFADPPDPARGADVFKAQCAACHLQKASDKSPPIGPQLLGVVGRKAGSWDHFNYTDAMRKSGLTWNAKLSTSTSRTRMRSCRARRWACWSRSSRTAST